VHTFLPGAFLVAVPISWLNRVKVVHSVLSVRSQPPGWYYPLMKLCQFMVNAFIVLEEKELNELGIPPSKITMSEVLLDFQKAYEVSRASQTTAKRNEMDQFVVLSAGRLHPDKGHDFAICAWPAVIKEFPNAKLWIAGSGNEESRLQELISTLDLRTSVELLGYVNNLEEIYSKIDLFLRMTTNEGANLTTLLAMAASRPIIAFKTNVPKDYIYHDFTGWFVPINEAELAQAIIHLLSMPDLRERLGSQAFISLKLYYDLARVVRYHEDLYTAVCHGNQTGLLPTMKEQMWPIYNPFLKKD
jgi:glycosyltransferase involved in cell wall biosynthesis